MIPLSGTFFFFFGPECLSQNLKNSKSPDFRKKSVIAFRGEIWEFSDFSSRQKEPLDHVYEAENYIVSRGQGTPTEIFQVFATRALFAAGFPSPDITATILFLYRRTVVC